MKLCKDCEYHICHYTCKPKHDDFKTFDPFRGFYYEYQNIESFNKWAIVNILRKQSPGIRDL
jgi:hypothetical protein